MLQERSHVWCRSLLHLSLVSLYSCTIQAPSREESDTPEVTAMESVTHSHHGIDYIEFAVTDMAESQQFYGAAFGWTFTDYGPDYAGIQGDGREAGGLRLEPKVSKGGPLPILYSRNLDATLASVRDAGGRIVTEPFDFPGGRRFHFLDPSGNELAVWSEK